MTDNVDTTDMTAHSARHAAAKRRMVHALQEAETELYVRVQVGPVTLTVTESVFDDQLWVQLAMPGTGISASGLLRLSVTPEGTDG